ncbi:MAG: hypothetical protein ABIJ09_20320 [Pseudomonadota bacterium]
MSDPPRPLYDPLLDDDDEDDGLRAAPDDPASGTWRRFEAFVPDVVKRGLVTGLGALFMTEEGVRSALTDLKLPKEVVTFLVSQAERSKRELTQTLAREVRSFLGDVDVSGVLQRALAGMTLEFKTQVRFIPQENGAQPRIEFGEVERPSASDSTAAPQPGPRAPTSRRRAPRTRAPKKPKEKTT